MDNKNNNAGSSRSQRTAASQPSSPSVAPYVLGPRGSNNDNSSPSDTAPAPPQPLADDNCSVATSSSPPAATFATPIGVLPLSAATIPNTTNEPRSAAYEWGLSGGNAAPTATSKFLPPGANRPAAAFSKAPDVVPKRPPPPMMTSPSSSSAGSGSHLRRGSTPSDMLQVSLPDYSVNLLNGPSSSNKGRLNASNQPSARGSGSYRHSITSSPRTFALARPANLAQGPLQTRNRMSFMEVTALLLHFLLHQRQALRGSGVPDTALAGAPAVSTVRMIQTLVYRIPDLFLDGLFHQLERTVKRYVFNVTPSSAESHAKRRLYNAFADFMKEATGERIGVSLAGSTAYEVDAKGSDLDVVLLAPMSSALWVLHSTVSWLSTYILTAGSGPSDSNGKHSALRDVNLQLVDSARVPVLSIKTPTGLVCDVSVNTLNSLRHTDYFKRVLDKTGGGPLRPLMRLLKYWAKSRKLPTMREGGLPAIVWMVLAVIFASCPPAVFKQHLVMAEESANESDDNKTQSEAPATCASILATCDETAPLFAALYRFFSLSGSSRASLSRTITVSKPTAYCAPKDRAAVSQRVASPQNHQGIWDEVVSIEDPAVAADPALPSAIRWLTAAEATSSTFEPGSSTDLAAKISSATWLVYLVELQRGAQILNRLLSFMLAEKNRVDIIPKLLLREETPASSSSSLPLNNGCSARPRLPGIGDDPFSHKSPHDFLARKLRLHLALLCQTSRDDRFLLPGCDERLRQLDDEASHTAPMQPLDIEWESSALTVANSTGSPFCFCCSRARWIFGVVLLHGRLHLLRITSVCADWTSWWSKEFLSRRDIRSVIHGTLYRIVSPEDYVGTVERHEDLFQLIEQAPYDWPAESPCVLDSGKVAYPHILLPVRKQIDSTPAEILFHPCNFVCRIRAWEVPGPPENLSAEELLLCDSVYYADSAEINYLRALMSIVEEAPWSPGRESPVAQTSQDLAGAEPNAPLDSSLSSASDDRGGSIPIYRLQPPAESCAKCQVFGDDFASLAKSLDYDLLDSVFQATEGLLELNVISAAWTRWVEHAKRTRSVPHPPPKTISADTASSASVSATETGAASTAPELVRATDLLASALDGLVAQNAPQVGQHGPDFDRVLPHRPAVRRSVSLPATLMPTRKVSTTWGGIEARRRVAEIQRYVPPSKRVATLSSSSEAPSVPPSKGPPEATAVTTATAAAEGEENLGSASGECDPPGDYPESAGGDVNPAASGAVISPPTGEEAQAASRSLLNGGRHDSRPTKSNASATAHSSSSASNHQVPPPVGLQRHTNRGQKGPVGTAVRAGKHSAPGPGAQAGGRIAPAIQPSTTYKRRKQTSQGSSGGEVERRRRGSTDTSSTVRGTAQQQQQQQTALDASRRLLQSALKGTWRNNQPTLSSSMDPEQRPMP